EARSRVDRDEALADGGRDGRLTARVSEGARDEHELVVARTRLESQLSDVRAHDEAVVARLAVQHRGAADAVAQVAEAGRCRVEGVDLIEVGRRARIRVELADQEGVVAVATVDGARRARVVEDEGVVAPETVDRELAVDAAVVADALDRAVAARDRDD